MPESKTQTSESFALASLASQGIPLSGCPFQSHPGVVAGRRSRRLFGGRRSPAGRPAERLARAREAGAEAVRFRRRPRLGRAEACGSRAVLSLSRSWRTERAMGARAAGESLRRPLSTAGGVFANAASEGQKVAARQPATAGSPERLSRRRAADMSRSDRERPRAFWALAVLSRARPYHLFKPVYKERSMAFWAFAVLSRPIPYHLFKSVYKERPVDFWKAPLTSPTSTAQLVFK